MKKIGKGSVLKSEEIYVLICLYKLLKKVYPIYLENKLLMKGILKY